MGAYTCLRCGKPLKEPLELNANYIMPLSPDDTTHLICRECLKSSDQIMWGPDKRRVKA